MMNWINNAVVAYKVTIGKDKPTGLLRIPGCEATTELPHGRTVEFNGEEYHNFAISPFGAIILGNDGTYEQTLSRTNLTPATRSPVICVFKEYLQVHA